MSISSLFTASLYNEDVSSTTASLLLASRRVSSGRVRDNKLMTVLNARRRVPNRWRSTEECERHCQVGNNNDFCKLKCNRDIKLIRSGGSQRISELSEVNEMSTNSNLVMESNADEFLDTEESVHGLSFADPISNGTRANIRTKESSNLLIKNEKLSVVDRKKDTKEKTSIEILTPTVTVSRRNKYSRTSLSPSIRRSTYRGRVKFSPSSLRTAEEIDEDPYMHIGPKSVSSTIRIPESKRYLSGRRTPIYQSTTASRSKEEKLEIMEVSVAKQSSTEKNKFWKTRNIVAINNYNRLNPQISSKVQNPEPYENTPKLTTVRYETIHTQAKEGQTATSISAVNNLAEGVDDIKNVYSRSTASNVTESPKKIYRQLPSLIINVPDDATPIFFNDPRNYEQSDGEIENSPTDVTNSEEMPTTNASDQKNLSKMPDIAEIFPNSSTISTFSPTELMKTSTTMLPSTVKLSIFTTVTKSSSFSTEPSFKIPVKTTKRVYTTIPRRKASSTTVSPDYNRTTISTFLSNISSKRIKIESSTNASTPPSTTVPYQFNEVTEKASNPVDVEIVAPPLSVTPESFTPSVQTNIYFQGISTTNKPVSNDVLVEMQKVNAAAFMMAGLGLIPLVVILIYVIKQYLYRSDNKDEDLENYGDIQPISPVVKLDQSDDGGSIDGGDSIISESDFNRSDLIFKSLLGEGNFGQVWKAEADNLAGHNGTRIVAVKTERANNGQGGLKVEGEIMRKLGSHSNVVTLLGACIEQGRI